MMAEERSPHDEAAGWFVKCGWKMGEGATSRPLWDNSAKCVEGIIVLAGLRVTRVSNESRC